MDKMKEITPAYATIAEWCETVGVSQPLFYAVWELFKDKTDKGGNPYIGHLIQVAQMLNHSMHELLFAMM